MLKKINKKNKIKKKLKNKNILFSFKITNIDHLLNFLYTHIKSIPKCKIKSMLEHHQVLVNGVSITYFNYLLSKDDEIILIKKFSKTQSNKIPFHILYEDKEIIVINKPSKLLSVSSDREMNNTAYRFVNDYVVRKNKRDRIFVVHRLDAETSGILMFAKNMHLKDALQKNWNNLVKKRSYYVVVEGEIKKNKGTLINFLKKNNLNLMYVTGDKKNGKKAITHYEVIKKNKKFSLLNINIDTGKQNQIRVQLGHINHYVIGDNKYGHPVDPLKRLALHAYCLELKHPFTNKIMSFKTSIPKDFFKLF